MAFALLFAVLLAQAQTAGPAPSGPSGDTQKVFSELVAQSRRMEPILHQIKPQDWMVSGAPQSFVTLWQSVTKDNQSIEAQAQALAPNPDKLMDSLHLLVTIEHCQVSIAELSEGVRKYQNPALAELILGLQAEGKAAREAYEQRVLELAGEREEQCAVADHEAQRCREILSKSPHSSHPAVK